MAAAAAAAAAVAEAATMLLLLLLHCLTPAITHAAGAEYRRGDQDGDDGDVEKRLLSAMRLPFYERDGAGRRGKAATGGVSKRMSGGASRRARAQPHRPQ